MPGANYHKLDSDQLNGYVRRWRPWAEDCGVKASMLLSLAVALAMGFVAGLLVAQSHAQSVRDTQAGFPFPQGPLYTKMQYNRTFSHAPSEASDTAWTSLFPEGDGFVREKTIAPKVSTLSVFHQLHCLNSLRVAYYAANSTKRDPGMQNEHGDPHHVRHCLDYLRQSLMCMVDTNVEPVDMQLGGSTGWGSFKTCRDLGAVKRWAEENKAIRHS